MLRKKLFQAVLSVVLVNFVGWTAVAMADAQSEADAILQASGVSAGFFVHLGAGDGELTEALRQNDATQVHGLVRTKNSSRVDAARTRVRELGQLRRRCFRSVLGSRASVCRQLGQSAW